MIPLCLFLLLQQPAAAAPAHADDSPQQLTDVHRIYVDALNGGGGAIQLRDMIISSLQRTRLFVLTENPDRADAVLKGSAEMKSSKNTSPPRRASTCMRKPARATPALIAATPIANSRRSVSARTSRSTPRNGGMRPSLPSASSAKTGMCCGPLPKKVWARSSCAQAPMWPRRLHGVSCSTMTGLRRRRRNRSSTRTRFSGEIPRPARLEGRGPL